MTARPLSLFLLLVFVAFAFGGCQEVYQDFYTDHHAGSSTGASGSGGDAGVCAPGAIMACYDGPPGTEGVGLCKPGAKTCAADGSSFGPCEGAILPVAENCATPVDEDCDGLAPACKGVLSWAKGFGDAGNQQGSGVAVDSAGDVFVIGTFGGSIDLGGGALTSAGGDDVFIAKFDASGNHLWSRSFGDASNQAPNGVAVDGAGNVLVAGYFFGAVDFGGGQVTSAGAGDVFVAKFDASGNYVWSRSFGDISNQSARGVAVDGAGNVLVTGYFFGAVDFGGGLRVANGRDIFVAKLDASGNHVWSKGFGDAGDQSGASVAVDSAGNVLVTGSFFGAVDFGGSTLASVGITDVFIAKLDASGNHVWSKRFGDAKDQSGASVAVDGADNALVTGYFSGSIDFGGGQLVSAGSGDIFVAKLDASGNHQWSKSFGDAEDQNGASIAVDSAGDAIVSGYFAGSVDFGESPLVCAGVRDVFVAKFGP